MTKKWTPRNYAKHISQLAARHIHELMADGEERTGEEIIDALLDRPRDSQNTLSHSVPTRREVSAFMQHSKYARRRGYVKETLPDGSRISKARTFYRKPKDS